MNSPRSKFLRLLTAVALLACGTRLVFADDAPQGPADPANMNEPVPLWEAGAVAIAAWQPAYPGADQSIARLRLFPYAVYRGSILRLDGNGLGVRAFRTPRFEWEASASASFGSSASQVHAREGMPSIGTLVELGPALKVNLGDLMQAGRDPRATRLELPVRAVFDANDRLARKGWTFEPRLSHTAWTSRDLSLIVTASTLWGDRKLNHLYYGVDMPYATADRPRYSARSGLVATRLGATLRQRVSSTVRLQWFTQLETVRGAANEASPLVRSRQDVGLGASLTWGFWHSTQKGVE